MSRRRSARMVTADASNEPQTKKSSVTADPAAPTENTIRVVSGATLGSGITSSKINLLDESIETLDLDWHLPDDDRSGVQPDAKVKRKNSRLGSLAQAASGASGALGSTVSTLGKRSREVYESGKGRLQQGMKRKDSKTSRLAKELEEFLPDPEPIPEDVGPTTKPRKKLPKGWSYVVPDAQLDEPAAKRTKTSEEAEEKAATTQLQNKKPSKISKPVVKDGPKHAKDKKWETKGLFAGQAKGFNPQWTESQNKARQKSLDNEKEHAIMPLPMFKAEDLLTTNQHKRDFLLPFDVFQPLDPREERPQKGDWQKLKTNKFVGDAAEEWKHQKLERSLCNCGEGGACDENCWNRTMSYECDNNNCSAGPGYCTNRAFYTLSRRAVGNRYDIGVDVVKTHGKGFGVQALRTFEEDQIIVEYAGEIITKDECERRMLNEYKDAECYYLMEFNQSMVIDATKGSIARFVNHSCDPNCKMEQWAVNQKPRMALFAKREIMTGEELTYDYNFAPFSKKNIQACHCGSKNCRGVIGPKLSKDKQREHQQQSEKPKPGGIIAGTKRKLVALFEKSAPPKVEDREDAPKPANNVQRKKPRLTEPEIPPRSSSIRKSPVKKHSTSRVTSTSTGNTTLVESSADLSSTTDAQPKRTTRSRSASDSDVVIRDSAKPVLQTQPEAEAGKLEKKPKRRLSNGNVLGRARESMKHRGSKLQRKRTTKDFTAAGATAEPQRGSENDPLNQIDARPVSPGATDETVTSDQAKQVSPLRPVIDWKHMDRPSAASTLKRKRTRDSATGPVQTDLYDVQNIYNSDSSVEEPARPISLAALEARKATKTARSDAPLSTKRDEDLQKALKEDEDAGNAKLPHYHGKPAFIASKPFGEAVQQAVMGVLKAVTSPVKGSSQPLSERVIDSADAKPTKVVKKDSKKHRSSKNGIDKRAEQEIPNVDDKEYVDTAAQGKGSRKHNKDSEKDVGHSETDTATKESKLIYELDGKEVQKEKRNSSITQYFKSSSAGTAA